MKSGIGDNIADLLSLKDMLPERKKRIKNAPETRITDDPVNDLARTLHPERLRLVIVSAKKETPTIKTFRLAPDPDSDTKQIPFFRAGQYISVKLEVDGVTVTRPYSISSSPREALEENFLEITIREKAGGFVTSHIMKKWKKGVKVETSGPCGFFCIDELRDTKEIVGLAGGCGFTPFRSMIKDIVDNDLDIKMTLLFGIAKPGEIIFNKELEALRKKAPDKIAFHYICSEPTKEWKGKSGFITRDLIKELAGEAKGKTFFICGPPAMYEFLEKELKPFRLEKKRIRREVFGETGDVTSLKGYPKKMKSKIFQITAHIGDDAHTIPAKASESVLVSLERAGLAPPSQCRSGECGFCDTLLMAGDIFVSPENDGRRMGSVKFNHFHPCASYPLADLEIKVMRPV